jgi:hypothetical protein
VQRRAPTGPLALGASEGEGVEVGAGVKNQQTRVRKDSNERKEKGISGTCGRLGHSCQPAENCQKRDSMRLWRGGPKRRVRVEIAWMHVLGELDIERAACASVMSRIALGPKGASR